jgi:DNA processing protein
MLDVVSAVALSLLPGRLRFDAVSRIHDAWRTGVLRPGDSLAKFVAHLQPDPSRRESAALLADRARRSLDRANRAGIIPVPFTSTDYPGLLGRIPDAPAVLWVRGDVPVLQSGAVAVVGARAASHAGRGLARRLAQDLAAAGLVVVSGLARGIDAAAHEGALATGRTIAVLGCGVDVTYPAEHGDLALRAAAAGALVAEFPPGTPPRAHHFPLRNRLISGLSLAVVVVEAGERSGSLITARTALDQGREVMAMPGLPAEGRNRGAHGLIRDGALLVENAEDVIGALRALPGPDRAAPVPAPPPDDPVLATMTPGNPVDLDVVARETGLDAQALLARVSVLQLDGWLERMPGGRIVRVSRKW